VIPDEAVEAAARAVYEDTFGKPWADESEDYRNELRETQRAALEAAAPHLMAVAWDEAHFAAIGCDSTCCDYMHDAPRGDMNPYRNANKEQV